MLLLPGLHIIPVLFEAPIPREKNWWTYITPKDTEDKKWLLKATSNFKNLNCMPAPPSTALEFPEVRVLVLLITSTPLFYVFFGNVTERLQFS